MENRLLPGLDNWLYNAKSSRRMRLVDGAMEYSEGPYRGQWGISKDDVLFAVEAYDEAGRSSLMVYPVPGFDDT